MIIAKSSINRFLNRDLRSFNWMKRLSRDDLVCEIKQLQHRPRFKTEPWLHQLVCTYIGICFPRFLFLLDMGLGKSKILLDLLTYALRSGGAEHGIVFVPRLINIDSWLDAIRDHSNLEPWLINCEDIGEKRERLLHPKGDITVVDYQGFALATSDKVKGAKGANKLVINKDVIAGVAARHRWMAADESHKVANTDSLWFDAVDNISARADFAFGTTGTLFGKHVEQAWPQFFLIDRGETLGMDKTLFMASFFLAEAGAFKQQLSFDKRQSRRLHVMLQNRSLRYDDHEVHDLPPVTRRRRYVEMIGEQAEHYARALDGVIQTGGGDPTKLASPWLRMRMLTSGYLRWEDEYGKHHIPFKHNPKLADLESMVVDELVDGKVIICYDYTDTGRMIVDRLQGLGIECLWLWGGAKDKSSIRRRFLDPAGPRIMVMNSEAGGTGVDELQDVCRYMIFYESPTPPTTRRQTEKRIARPGQKWRCFIYDLVIRNTVDTGILTALSEGFDLHDAIVTGRLGRDRVKKLLMGG